jgi:hypothetical protein
MYNSAVDLEELNTSQIILLALLVSFVTSIATGIVTVSLLAQAPPTVTNTVNQIVERTIETVLPAENNQHVTTTVKETTVVVKEDELITDSIAQSLGKTGRVYQGIATSTPVVGLAEQIGTGVLITDSTIVDGDHLINFGGASAVFTVSQEFPSIGVAVLIPKSASSTPGLPPAFRIGDTNGLKLGQTVIALVSVVEERVAIGAVSSRSELATVQKKDAGKSDVRSIDTNIVNTLVPGTPLVNIFGDIVGISTAVSEAKGRGSFVSISDFALLLAPSATTTPRN